MCGWIYKKDRAVSTRRGARQRRRKARTNRMLILVTTIFFLSWTPISIFNFAFQFSGEVNNHPLYRNSLLQCIFQIFESNDGSLIIFSIVHLIAMTNVITNPIMYGFLNQNFKQSLISLVRFW